MNSWQSIFSISATAMGLGFPVSGAAQDFTLRSEPLKMYVDAVLNDYHVFVDHNLFFSQMPEVIGYADLDSTSKAQLNDRLMLMADVTKNDGIVHLELDNDWKPLLERLLGNNLRTANQIYIVEMRTGASVPHIWYLRKMKTSHGPGRYRYFADKDHKNLVFTLKIPGGGGHPMDRF